MASARSDRFWGDRVYDLIGVVMTLVVAPLVPLVRRSRHGERLDERFGIVPTAARGLARPLWLHAASVGEVLSTEPLIRELRRERPDLPIVVSTTSTTGRATAAERLGADAVMLLPLDVAWIVRRCLRALQPRLLVIVETEIWPALIREVSATGTPVAIVSGRISEPAARRYRRVRWFLRRVLQRIDLIARQSDTDAERMRSLGAPGERIVTLGSLKFARDTGAGPPRPRRGRLSLRAERPIFVAASTQPGEEDLVIDACTGLWQRDPHVLLVVAPRRPDRFAEVAALLERRGLAFVRRSTNGASLDAHTQVLLLDSLGELADAFPAARAVYVGGTMGGVGGHNVLEPAVFARPVSFGPDTTNVAAAAQELLDAGAARRVADAAELASVWGALLDDPESAQSQGRAGRAVVDRQTAVAARTAAVLLPYLGEAAGESRTEPA